MANQYGTNTGHGHVWERPDGVKARCGGPGLCSTCALDAARVAARGKETVSPYLQKEPRTRLQAAYEICPELREVVDLLRMYDALQTGQCGVCQQHSEMVRSALAKLDKIK